MKKKLIKISTLLLAALIICVGLVGCELPKRSSKQLDTPEVTISYEGKASWAEVEHALSYIYVIDDGEETSSDVCHVQLEDEQTIKVKAVSGSSKYTDSEFSEPKTYRKGEFVPLSFYAVNDLHGKVMDTSQQPGVDEFTTYMKALYEDETREEILLSSGDMWQGTVESSTNKGALMTDWMNELGFVSMTLGNHEYDWGAAVLTPRSEQANFPFLAINVTQDGEKVSYCQASTIVEKSGVKIGIIGAIGDCLSSISGDYTDGLYFAKGNALTNLVKTESTRLREEEECDFIVYSIHDGGSGFSSDKITSVTNKKMGWYDSALSNGYVDLVFEAHTHQGYILEDEYGVYHLQGGGENKYVSCADVSFNTATKEYTVSPRLIDSDEYANGSIEGDPVVGDLFNTYFPEENPYTTALGYNSTTRYSDDITNQVAQLYYEKGIEEWGNKYDIVLGGGYLKARTPYRVYKGNVTYADLFSVLPFDNDIVLGKISGKDLKSQFLYTDNTDYHIYPTAQMLGDAFEDYKYYYIIVDSYTSTYKWNNITEVERLRDGTYARDLLAAYVRGGGWE